MKERIMKVLAEIEEDILTYEGENIIVDGVIDSIQLIDIVVSLEEEFNIEIDVKDVIQENFKTVDSALKLVSLLL